MALLLAGFGSGVVSADDDPRVTVGATRAEVVARLGTPGGHLRIGAREILLYDRGKVQLEEGVVTEVRLVSTAEAQLRKEQLSRLRLEQAAYERARRVDLLEEGTRILEERLTDGLFLALPADDRVTYWTDFRQRYTDVDVSVPYRAALEDCESEQRARRMERKLAELERRTEEAERRARWAESRASSANSYPAITYNGYPYINGQNVIQMPAAVTRFPTPFAQIPAIVTRPAVHRHPNATFVINTAPTTASTHATISGPVFCQCPIPCGQVYCRSRFTLSPQGINAHLSLPW